MTRFAVNGLLRALRAKGVTVAAEGGRVRLRGRGVELSGAEAALLREYEADVAAAVAAGR